MLGVTMCGFCGILKLGGNTGVDSLMITKSPKPWHKGDPMIQGYLLEISLALAIAGWPSMPLT